ncbi:hypothetical protein J5H54_10340, partial [Providencia rettgeri]|uniref:hypothetical protein n=1 Tax=Providencia rettgeri TaxID=587 RepID=UPI001AAF9CF9
ILIISTCYFAFSFQVIFYLPLFFLNCSVNKAKAECDWLDNVFIPFVNFICGELWGKVGGLEIKGV